MKKERRKEKKKEERKKALGQKSCILIGWASCDIGSAVPTVIKSNIYKNHSMNQFNI